MKIPDDLRYAENHEWARLEDDGRVRVGITDYAQDQLGDVVFVDLPQVGRSVQAGDAFAEVESTKSVADVYAPISGSVAEVNETLADSPEHINSDPYGAGWFVVIEPDEGANLDHLMAPSEYASRTE